MTAQLGMRRPKAAVSASHEEALRIEELWIELVSMKISINLTQLPHKHWRTKSGKFAVKYQDCILGQVVGEWMSKEIFDGTRRIVMVHSTEYMPTIEFIWKSAIHDANSLLSLPPQYARHFFGLYAHQVWKISILDDLKQRLRVSPSLLSKRARMQPLQRRRSVFNSLIRPATET